MLNEKGGCVFNFKGTLSRKVKDGNEDIKTQEFCRNPHE